MARKEKLALLRKRKRVRTKTSAERDKKQPQAAYALRRLAAGRASSADVLSLQRSLGNAVVQRALADKGFAAKLMRVDEKPGAAESPARKKLQELSEVDIGKPGQANSWSATPMMTALMAITMEMVDLLSEMKAAVAGQVVQQMTLQMEMAEELTKQMKDAAEKEAGRKIMAASAAMATGVLSMAVLARRVEPRQARILATKMSAFDPVPQKLLAVEAGKAAQTEAELVGLTELVGTTREVLEGYLDKARSEYKENDELLKRLFDQVQQEFDDKLNPSVWRA